MPVEKQVIIVYAATRKYLIDLPVEDVLRFQDELFDYIDTKYPEIPEAIATTKQMDEETEKKLIQAIEECKAEFQK
jgi:F-type H+-transporting ATPase subunit alpha